MLRISSIFVLAIATNATLFAATPPSSAPATTQSAANKVAEFQGEYRFLSNFFPAEVIYEGITYPTSEHAYQAAKSLDPEQRKKIAAMKTPAEAKAAGRALKLRDDWETAKFTVMEDVVRYKFTHHDDLRQKLLATGNAVLEEGNAWNDQIWGISPPNSGKGENHLGKILSKIRSELRGPS
jgi:ribA/ribD-fused uncharacterized protein